MSGQAGIPTVGLKFPGPHAGGGRGTAVQCRGVGRWGVSVKILALGPRNQQDHYHLPGGRTHTLQKALVSTVPSQAG